MITTTHDSHGEVVAVTIDGEYYPVDALRHILAIGEAALAHERRRNAYESAYVEWIALRRAFAAYRAYEAVSCEQATTIPA